MEKNILALIKSGEYFIFVYDDESVSAVIADICNKAADPLIKLDWRDADDLLKRLREGLAASEIEL